MSKYRAVRTEVDGVMFASKKEARRFAELMLLQKAGEISGLLLQPKFPLHTHRAGEYIKIGTYVADFSYRDHKGAAHVLDVKGFQTPLFRWKRKHVEAEYGIKVELV